MSIGFKAHFYGAKSYHIGITPGTAPHKAFLYHLLQYFFIHMRRVLIWTYLSTNTPVMEHAYQKMGM